MKINASDDSAERISKDIDRMFPNHKEGGALLQTGILLDEHTSTSKVFKGESTGMVLEKGNFEWTKEQLAVARAKGIVIND